MLPIMNLAAPGTEYGPCLGECNHPRCNRARKAATSLCRLCRREIGYSVDYVANPGQALSFVHAVCRRKEIGHGSTTVPIGSQKA